MPSARALDQFVPRFDAWQRDVNDCQCGDFPRPRVLRRIGISDHATHIVTDEIDDRTKVQLIDKCSNILGNRRLLVAGRRLGGVPQTAQIGRKYRVTARHQLRHYKAPHV